MKSARSISLLVVSVALTTLQAVSQSVGIGGSNFVPHASSILEMQHDAKGVLLPRLTTSQRTDIIAPAKGLIIFNEETDHFEFWDGARWVEMCNDCQNNEIPGTATQTLSHDGTTWVANSVIRTDGVTVGIGTPPSVYDLDVDGTVNAVGYRMIAGAGEGKVLVSDSDGLFEWVDRDDVLSSVFKISELDSLTFAPKSPAYAGKGLVIGSRILGDPDFTHPPQWESRMFFDAATTNAFRAGTSNDGAWNAVNLGDNSFATGYNTRASGTLSTAMGDQSVASGLNSVALGTSTTASGIGSVAIGVGSTATQSQASAFGYGADAIGQRSVALGDNATAQGTSSIAIGQALAEGLNSVAITGGWAESMGSYSFGYSAKSAGNRSISIGYGVEALSGNETVLGAYNTSYTPSSTTGWNAADRLLVVGNGDFFNRSDAVVVKKSGRTGIGSDVTQAQLHVSGADGILVTGTHGSGATIEVSGAGTRMFFNPRKSAFRAGAVSSASWDNANVGNYSFASGNNVMASGDNSAALGNTSVASGNGSLAWGQSNVASGSTSFAGGFSSDATGNTSVAIGGDVAAPSAYEAVFGRWNTAYTPASTTAWNTADRLFVVGNGTGSGARSDAMVILKNGNVGIGDSAPVALLEVAGDALINSHTVGRGGGNVSNNVAIGLGALEANLVSGVSNTAIGRLALDRNTSGDYQVAIGQDALGNNNTGSRGVAIGYQAMGMNASGTATSSSVAVGYQAGGYITTGYGNVFVGLETGRGLTTGYDNTWVGKHIGNSGTPNYFNSTAIGNGTPVDADNKARIGNSSVTSNGGQVNWTAYSDARIKDNVVEEVVGLDFIRALRPVTYNFNVDRQNALQGSDSDDFEGKYDIEKIKFSGFIAQEVEEAAKTVGYDFSGVDRSGDLLGIRYAEFTVPLVKAMQELTELLDERTARIEELELLVKQLMEQSK